MRVPPHPVTTDCAFTLANSAFPEVGTVLGSTAQLQSSAQHSHRAALTLHTWWGMHTGTPEGHPAASRLSLKGRSTLATSSSPLAWPGACWSTNKLSVRPIASRWDSTSAFPWCCLELLYTHSPLQSHSPWSRSRALPRPTTEELGAVSPRDSTRMCLFVSVSLSPQGHSSADLAVPVCLVAVKIKILGSTGGCI